MRKAHLVWTAVFCGAVLPAATPWQPGWLAARLAVNERRLAVPGSAIHDND